MVVWVYAGGGESEVAGLIPFLQQHLPQCSFERKTPIRRKPGPRPDAHVPAYGLTGKSLVDQIHEHVAAYWEEKVGAVIVMDDSDSHNPEEHQATLRRVVVATLEGRGIDFSNGGAPLIAIALAVPELEAWLLADWDKTFRSLGGCHSAVQHELSTNRGVSTNAPEQFVVLGDDGAYRKLSGIIQEVIAEKCQYRYSKATDTPRLLARIDPQTVSRRCPYFKKFWTAIATQCGKPKGARA